jgi:hypothetical protein
MYILGLKCGMVLKVGTSSAKEISRRVEDGGRQMGRVSARGSRKKEGWEGESTHFIRGGTTVYEMKRGKWLSSTMKNREKAPRKRGNRTHETDPRRCVNIIEKQKAHQVTSEDTNREERKESGEGRVPSDKKKKKDAGTD